MARMKISASFLPWDGRPCLCPKSKDSSSHIIISYSDIIWMFTRWLHARVTLSAGKNSVQSQGYPSIGGREEQSLCETWWRIGWVNSFQPEPPEGRGFDSRSSRHVGTLGKSLTRSCLWRFGVYQCICVSVLCRGRFWVVVDLKRRCRNSLNEFHTMIKLRDRQRDRETDRQADGERELSSKRWRR